MLHKRALPSARRGGRLINRPHRAVVDLSDDALCCTPCARRTPSGDGTPSSTRSGAKPHNPGLARISSAARVALVVAHADKRSARRHTTEPEVLRGNTTPDISRVHRTPRALRLSLERRACFVVVAAGGVEDRGTHTHSANRGSADTASRSRGRARRAPRSGRRRSTCRLRWVHSRRSALAFCILYTRWPGRRMNRPC